MIEPSAIQTYREKGHDMLILRPQRAGRVYRLSSGWHRVFGVDGWSYSTRARAAQAAAAKIVIPEATTHIALNPTFEKGWPDIWEQVNKDAITQDD